MRQADFSMQELIDAGVHFGHIVRRWNPKMKPYIFGERNNTHIINLQHTVILLQQALDAVRDKAADGGRILFVGTKRQAQEMIRISAESCGQYYVNHRWLGGMLTNWLTITNSIERFKELDERLKGDLTDLTKKEILQLSRKQGKLERALGGIQDMPNLPDIIFIIDVVKESTAVAEAQKLGIPVVAIVDSNANPEGIDYPIPGNDDSSRAIKLYCELMSKAVLKGLSKEQGTPAQPKKAADADADADAGDKTNAVDTSDTSASDAAETTASSDEGGDSAAPAVDVAAPADAPATA
ncbi:MAG: 30S ribosomal protein S2 [Alphaproteobacteria bacterium]|nr:30S ribosomal protein S2 [Alphaproteobacteria bacterium]